MLFVAPAAHPAERLKPQDVEAAAFARNADSRAMTAKLQILLDRAGFSPGVIDGHRGENVDMAVAAYRDAQGLGTDAKVDEGSSPDSDEPQLEVATPVPDLYGRQR